ELCRAAGALLVHYSTDYVFEGNKNAPYIETDPVNPQNAYGRSKALGEANITAVAGDAVILRTGWVFASHGDNFYKKMLKLANQRDTLAALGIALLVLALLLVHYRPAVEEGFALAAVNPLLVPACVERSTAAQSLLARFGSSETSAAAELRLLVSKLCCLEADIATPAAGRYRTLPLQFRTSHDMEPASSFVGRCLRNAVRERDIDLVIAKFEGRGGELLAAVLGGDCGDAQKELADVVARTRLAMTTTCLRPQPQMDRPLGARDMGFWEPRAVGDLATYQGISAQPQPLRPVQGVGAGDL
ncbi:MAG: NAD-dependent epimerase/dehydratase family protein, partial [Betaproteobacteria bacterium]|nr:NAD-dependent epimerase/dehydratase family protein [Betaproteobacteria bacterium]